MQRRIVLLISVISLFSVAALSQSGNTGTVPAPQKNRDFGLIERGRISTYDSSENFVVGDVKGTIKTKAVYLAKPEYPEAARLAGVEGAVRVRVSINEDGSVTDAEAIEGDQTLRAVAEDAARRSKFRIPRDINRQVVKEDGVLAYSFEITKAGWSWIAYRLSGLDKMPLYTFSIPPALKALPQEWTDEREMFKKLDEIRRSQPDFPKRPVFVRSQTTVPMRLPNGMMAQSSTIQGTLAVPPPIQPEQITISRELISALKARLADNKLAAWQFDLGLQLHDAFQRYGSSSNAADIIHGLIENHPDGVSLEVLTALQELEAIAMKDTTSKETMEAIRKAMTVIIRSK